MSGEAGKAHQAEGPFLAWPAPGDLRFSLLLCLSFFLFFELTYIATNYVTGLHRFRVNVHSSAELGIPFVPAMAVVYISLDLMLALTPFVLRSWRDITPLGVVMTLETLICASVLSAASRGYRFAAAPSPGRWIVLGASLGNGYRSLGNGYRSLHNGYRSLSNGYRWLVHPYRFLDAQRRRRGLSFQLDLPILGHSLVTGDPALVREIVLHPDLDSGRGIVALRAILGDRSLITLDGHEHRERRRLLAPAFSARVIESYDEITIGKTGAVIGDLGQGKQFSFYEAARRISLSAIVRFIFGEKSPGEERSLEILVEDFLASFHNPLVLYLKFLQVDLGPASPWGRALRNRDRLRARIRSEIGEQRKGRNGSTGLLAQCHLVFPRADACIIGGADALVRSRPPGRPVDVGKHLIPRGKERDEGVLAQRAPRPGGPPHNLCRTPDFRKLSDIGLLAALFANGAGRGDYDPCDDDLTTEVLTLLMFGHDTGAAAMAWVMVHLLQHPEAMERARAEAETIEGGGAPARSFYLEACIRESMRLCPVVVNVTRVARRDLEIGGYRVREGERVLPCAYLAHHNEEVFPDAGRFVPERFLNGHNYGHAYFPFGIGGRLCLGEPFAMRQMVLILSTFLAQAALEFAPGYQARPARNLVRRLPAKSSGVLQYEGGQRSEVFLFQQPLRPWPTAPTVQSIQAG